MLTESRTTWGQACSTLPILLSSSLTLTFPTTHAHINYVSLLSYNVTTVWSLAS